jgi:hypothetical protein
MSRKITVLIVLTAVAMLGSFMVVEDAPGKALVAPRMSIAQAQGTCYNCYITGGYPPNNWVWMCIDVGPGQGDYTWCTDGVGPNCNAGGTC